MALSPFVYQVLQTELDKVLAIDDAEVLEAAKKIAFYEAMIDAALEDPFSNNVDQEEILEHLRKTKTELTETYQSLVNDILP